MGKTTVLRFFQTLGAYTINADELVHEILKNPVIIKKLTALLGKEILSKRASKVFINKKNMADIIFADPEKRESAENIIHPEVIKMAQQIKRKILSKNKKAIIIFEVPLLFEAGYKNIFDKTMVAYCKKTTAINRLMRKGISKQESVKRMRVQIPISRKKKYADFLINTDAAISDTKLRTKAVFRKLAKNSI